MDEHKCSNCGKAAKVSKSLIVQEGNGREVARICESCQKASKIQITLERSMEGFQFYQYFPVEA
jgi:hypothetical protein